jgi:hypothetical protein
MAYYISRRRVSGARHCGNGREIGLGSEVGDAVFRTPDADGGYDVPCA